MSEPFSPRPIGRPRERAPRPVPRPDRQFYASSSAFGRFGVRWFDTQIMDAPHAHGHIELNWLTAGSVAYLFDGRPVTIPSERLIMFWAGVSHQAVGLDPGPTGECRQCNVYLPLDSFLCMPKLGTLTETMMGGGVIALTADTIGAATLHRWYQDYRSGDVERTDILKSEIATMLRRAVVTGWEEIMPPWIEASCAVPRSASPLRHVVAMLRHIIEHISEPLTAPDIAAVVGLHPNYATSLFSSAMRVPIHKFVLRMRLIKARAMLFEGNLSIENVAFHSGFASLSQFYVHFRKAYGLTPNQLRTNYVH